MVLGLITFLWGQKFLYGHADPRDPALLKEKVGGVIPREWLIYLLSIVALGVIWLLVQHEPIVYATQNIFLVEEGDGRDLPSLRQGQGVTDAVGADADG